VPDRREFFGNLAGGTAAVAVSAPRPAGHILGANGRIRFGIAAAGARGMEIFRAALTGPNAEAVSAADVCQHQRTVRRDSATEEIV